MYGAIIINDNIQNTVSHLKTYKDKLDTSGNVFVLVRNEVDMIGDVTHDFFDVIDVADKMGFFYVNTIVVPTDFTPSNLPDNVLYVVWIAKDKNHFFNNFYSYNIIHNNIFSLINRAIWPTSQIF